MKINIHTCLGDDKLVEWLVVCISFTWELLFRFLSDGEGIFNSHLNFSENDFAHAKLPMPIFITHIYTSTCSRRLLSTLSGTEDSSCSSTPNKSESILSRPRRTTLINAQRFPRARAIAFLLYQILNPGYQSYN